MNTERPKVEPGDTRFTMSINDSEASTWIFKIHADKTLEFNSSYPMNYIAKKYWEFIVANKPNDWTVK